MDCGKPILLRNVTEDAVKQIVCEGERFDVMSARQWRERVSRQASP